MLVVAELMRVARADVNHVSKAHLQMFAADNGRALAANDKYHVLVIVLFAIRRREIRTPSEIFRNLILPALGVAATLILWINLSPDSFNYGLIWLVLGIGVMLVLTRFWTKPLRVKLEEDDMPPMDELYDAMKDQA
mgnify:CR=1 FL=1